MLAVLGFSFLITGFIFHIRKCWNHYRFLKGEKNETASFRDLFDPSKDFNIKLKATSPFLITNPSARSDIDILRTKGNFYAKCLYAWIAIIIIIQIFI